MDREAITPPILMARQHPSIPQRSLSSPRQLLWQGNIIFPIHSANQSPFLELRMKSTLKISWLPLKGRSVEGMSADHWLIT